MLLTIETTHRPATDLGFLLHKNPDRLHEKTLSFGRAVMCFPEAEENRCRFALTVEVDPIGLVRGRAPGASLHDHYVNDRPYAASGRLDVVIVAEHVGFPPALRWSPFLREPLWLIAPKGTGIHDPLQLLNTKPFVRFRSSVPLANLIETEISRWGVVTQDIAEIDTIGSIVTCVRQGLGVSVVPHVALQEPDYQELDLLPFGEPQVHRQIGIVERTVSPRTEIIARLHEVLAQLCGEHGVSRPQQ